MKIEKPGDKKFLDHDFTAPWKEPISEKTWQKFLEHDFKDPSREVIYKIFDQYFKSLIGTTFKSKQFLEIGFGQAFDYLQFFKHYHDMGTITYSGWDVTKQFVDFARKKEGTENNPPLLKRFFKASFKNLNSLNNLDILYTRHTFEHQYPDNCYPYLNLFLSKIEELGIICWFQPPGKERFSWNDRD